ncbi:leucine-rich repeat protein, putative [Bodo saltans]|uniref:Leucine-rich repeat protein, putative n=1 Tax=Bodo saltans TaxID=75058 RepID=A0A0S4IQY0_BODSA|nr:leucine-rich repeat protein, putative [Bodo saltans]|eukprot:CUF36081.1 leucine-rich repeat protein, putative [Bodo saltans]
MLLNHRSEKYLKYRAQKQQLFQEEEVMTDRVGRMILSLDPNLQAVAVHIARDNKFVDALDLSSTPLEPRCSDEVIAVMTGLMKQNTHVKEVSFANSGGYFNAHRSMPLIAEMGVRLETLDMTNCHLGDGHVGALAAMLQTPECVLETLVLDDNYISSVGARKLAKAIRASKTLSCVSVSKNSNTSVDDLKLLQFYCDLNKFTPHFKETILRVEANDPALTELYRAQKQQLFQEEEVMTDRVGRMILSLDPNLQAVAVHIARDNKFVDALDLSSTPLEPRCSDEVIAVMTGLMKQNTHVKEVSFANSGGYFNAHRSMPLIAEMGVRLETLDMTNCHLGDGHVGALAAMLQTPECVLETLVLDDNYISSVGARKLAKAIRASKTLSCVSVSKNSNTSVDDLKLLQFYCDLNKFTPHFKETILRVEANDPALTELHFDRRGNLDERCVFDDVSMRLLCAALPHNTHVERIFLAGNHVSDEGAICLLNLLKSKVNRSVYVVDLSGNDVSPALVDELSRLVLIRLGETIEQTVYNPEEITRAAILHDDRGFWFWLERLKHIAVGWREMVQSYEYSKDFEIGRSFHDAHLDYHVMQYERHGRQKIVEEERMFAEVSEYVHDSVVRGYQPVVLDYLRAMRRTFMNGQQEMEDLIEELDRQPNLDLRRNALYILNNMRRIESLDLSSTLPSDFCEQEILCNGRTVDIALRMLSKNKTVKRLNFANNDGRIPGWSGIWPLSHRLEFLDVSRCGLTDAEVPAICQMISDPMSTIIELNLDGNLFSEVGCMDILRCLRHNAETRAHFPLKKISIQDCPHVSENLISTIEFISDLLRCAPAFRELMLRLRFGTEEVRTVDAQDMEITDDLCKILCVALKNHKSVKAIKLRKNRITDIGVDYLCRLVKTNHSIEYVDVSENDVSSVARRQLASLLEERLGKRLGNDVQLPEEFHREDIIYEESMFPRFFWHYNKLAPNVFRHYERAVDMFVNFSGRFTGIDPVFRPENEARRGGVEVIELQQRMLLYKWMQYHQWIVSFCDRTTKQKKQWIGEGETAVRELRGLVASHPSRELREKAFKIALNSPNIVSLSLVQQCDEDAVIILGKILKGNTFLKELNLSGNHQIKPSWVLPLIGEANTNLEVLNMSDCNLRDGDIADPLKGLLTTSKCKLLKVIFDRNFLTQNSIQRVVPVLRETNHILTEVSLKHNPELSRTPLHYLDFCLELNKYIGVGHEHGKREDYLKIKELLVQVEANRPNIATLNFVNDQYALLMLDDQFAKLVCIALAHNTHVRTLYIRGHQITDKGAQYILQVLQGINRSLDFVDLHGNFVSDSMLLAIEYAIPWRHYASDLDKLLDSAYQAFQDCYDHYESFFFTNKRDHQLMIIRPCFDSRAEIEKSEDMVYRKLLCRYPEWLRFADAWHKSYKYAFQRTFLQAEETLPLDNTMVDSRMTRSVVDAFSFRGNPTSPPAAGTSKLLDAVTALKAQLLPDFLRQKYLKFVSLADLYEQKCVRNLEKVFAQCSPVSATATEQFLTSTYAAARIPSIFIPSDRQLSSPPGGLRTQTSSERLGTPSPSVRRAVTPSVSFSDGIAAPQDPLSNSGTFGSRVQSFFTPNKSPPQQRHSNTNVVRAAWHSFSERPSRCDTFC